MSETTYIMRTVVGEDSIEQTVETRSAEETKWYLRGLKRGRWLGYVDAKDAADGKFAPAITLDLLVRDNEPKESLVEITPEEARGRLTLGD